MYTSYQWKINNANTPRVVLLQAVFQKEVKTVQLAIDQFSLKYTKIHTNVKQSCFITIRLKSNYAFFLNQPSGKETFQCYLIVIHNWLSINCHSNNNLTDGRGTLIMFNHINNFIITIINNILPLSIFFIWIHCSIHFLSMQNVYNLVNFIV